jgi:hypothetical protein
VWDLVQEYTQHIITGLWFLSALASLVFVIRFASKKWWTSGAGRMMMIFHLTIVGFGINSVIFLITGGDWPGRLFLTFVLVVALNYVNWGWSLELHRAQKDSLNSSRLSPNRGHDHRNPDGYEDEGVDGAGEFNEHHAPPP